MTTIYVDADACPVKDEVIRVAERHNIKTIMVSDGGLRPSRDPLIEIRIVSQGADAADNWIIEQIEAGDVCVTADIPLAKRVIEQGARAIKPNGNMFDDTNIGIALAVRDLKQHIRESNQSQTYNAAFTKADRSKFLDSLHQLLIKQTSSNRNRKS